MTQSTTAGGVFGKLANRFHDGMQKMQTDPTAQLGLRMLANSGPSPVKRGVGEIFATSMLQQQQAGQQSEEDNLRRAYMKAQTEAMSRGPQRRPIAVMGPDGKPQYVDEQDAIGMSPVTSADGSSRTADIQNYEFFKSLSPEDQKRFLGLQRQPTVPQLSIINGVPSLVDRLNQTVTPLTNLGSEISAASQKASAEAQAKAIGTATGEAEGGIQKKAVTAQSALDVLNMAEPLVDIATGSATGAAADKVAKFFGKATDGATANAQLKILQATLMTSMPRMEGPQSDKDVQLYREAAGELGDSTVPREQKKAAIATIRNLNKKYQSRGAAPANQFKEGQTATNQKTGEKMVYRGGKWQKM